MNRFTVWRDVFAILFFVPIFLFCMPFYLVHKFWIDFLDNVYSSVVNGLNRWCRQ